MNKPPYIFVFYLFILFIVGCEQANEPIENRAEVLPGASRLSDLLGAGDRSGFPLALRPRTFEFPADHGPHNEFRNEWWYFTGNLDGPDDERFGYELTFFRFALAPDSPQATASRWKTNQVYIAHFAITDPNNDEFHVAQRYSRGGAGLAGATSEPFNVWLDDWSIVAVDENHSAPTWQLSARHRNSNGTDFGLVLDLEALKPPVLNGKDGLSQKSDQAGNASYYYSMSRFQSTGSLSIGKETYAVSGLSWLDREWGSSALSAEQRGWDWFALQLSDGNDLMFYNIRKQDDVADSNSAGTWIDANGSARPLDQADVSIEVLDTWVNDRGDEYPAKWQLFMPSTGVSLTITPVAEDQELITNVRYWEGAVDVTGTNGSRSITGRGYVELTGYADR